MSLYDEITADLPEIRADLGNPTGAYQGAEYPCIPEGFDRIQLLSIGGQDVEIHGSVRVAISDLGAVVPVTGKHFTFREITYKVALVYKDASQAFFCLRLNDPNR